MQASCSSCSNVVTVDENNPKLPEGAFSVKCPKCQTAVRFPAKAARLAAMAAAEPEVVDQSEMAPPPASSVAIPIKPTALPGERALWPSTIGLAPPRSHAFLVRLAMKST